MPKHLMRVIVLSLSVVLFAGLALLPSGCGSDSDPGSPNTSDALLTAIMDAGEYPETTPSEDPGTPGAATGETRSDGSLWSCTTRTVTVTDAPEEYFLFDPNSEVVYPGNLLQGESLGNATPSDILVDRGPATFTIDLLNGSPTSSVTVPEVTLATATGAINEIIAKNTGVLTAQFGFEFREVQSLEQLAIEVGVSYEGLTTDAKGKFSFASDTRFNSVLVKLTQQYFTISRDRPGNPTAYFGAGVTAEDVAPFMGPGNPGTFISSMTYGRIFYLLVQSTDSVQKISAAVEASYKGGAAQADFNSSLDYVHELSEKTINVFAMGGDSKLAASTLGGDYEQVKAFLRYGQSIDTGAPLSYVVRPIAHPDETLKIGIAGDYDVKECSLIREGDVEYQLSLTKIKCWDDCDAGAAGLGEWRTTIYLDGASTGIDQCLYLSDGQEKSNLPGSSHTFTRRAGESFTVLIRAGEWDAGTSPPSCYSWSGSDWEEKSDRERVHSGPSAETSLRFQDDPGECDIQVYYTITRLN